MRRWAILAAALLLLVLSAPPAGAAERVKFDEFEVLGPPPPEPVKDACGVAVETGGRVFVSSYYGHQVDAFTPHHEASVALSTPASLPGPCDLALDQAGDLYVNLWHGAVLEYRPNGVGYLPPITVDPGPATGIAVDPVGEDLLVDRRTYVAEYEPSGAPVMNGAEPLKIGLGSLQEGFGLAVSAFGGDESFEATAGLLYVTDAADGGSVKVYEPGEPTEVARTIEGDGTPQHGFVDLDDADVTVDPSDGHVYVTDNLGPGSENPQLGVDEFSPAGRFRETVPADVEQGRPSPLTDAEPSGLAVSGGKLYVSSGNYFSEEDPQHRTNGKVVVYDPPAQFKVHTLTVAKSGGGEGLVISGVPGIGCGKACSGEFEEDSTVVLTATPAAHSRFAGWSGCPTTLSGMRCQVSMNADLGVGAAFEAIPQLQLSVSVRRRGRWYGHERTRRDRMRPLLRGRLRRRGRCDLGRDARPRQRAGRLERLRFRALGAELRGDDGRRPLGRRDLRADPTAALASAADTGRAHPLGPDHGHRIGGRDGDQRTGRDPVRWMYADLHRRLDRDLERASGPRCRLPRLGRLRQLRRGAVHGRPRRRPYRGRRLRPRCAGAAARRCGRGQRSAADPDGDRAGGGRTDRVGKRHPPGLRAADRRRQGGAEGASRRRRQACAAQGGFARSEAEGRAPLHSVRRWHPGRCDQGPHLQDAGRIARMRRPQRIAVLGLMLGLLAAWTSTAPAEIVQKGPLRVAFLGSLSPTTLPREAAAPISVAVGGRISTTDGSPPPQLRRVTIAINRNGHFDSVGLPDCALSEIQPSSTQGALEACRHSLVGEGSFAAEVKLPEQAPFPSHGKVLAFNGRLHGRPVIFAHVYGTHPLPTSYTLTMSLAPSRGTFGTRLTVSLPAVSANVGSVTGIEMDLHRNFIYRGERHSYLSAGCPAPKGFPGAVFPLAKISFAFAGGHTLSSTLTRHCGVRG